MPRDLKKARSRQEKKKKKKKCTGPEVDVCRARCKESRETSVAAAA